MLGGLEGKVYLTSLHSPKESGDEDGAFCAHVRNKIIRRCHEWMLKQEEGK